MYEVEVEVELECGKKFSARLHTCRKKLWDCLSLCGEIGGERMVEEDAKRPSNSRLDEIENICDELDELAAKLFANISEIDKRI